MKFNVKMFHVFHYQHIKVDAVSNIFTGSGGIAGTETESV